MKRNIDLHCNSCGNYLSDQIVAEDDIIRCQKCNSAMEHVWWVRRTRTCTEWPESEAVVVFQKPDGTFSFPAVNTKPCPDGWTKHVARSDRQLAAIEQMTHTRNEARWFDKGTGRGFDSHTPGFFGERD